MSSCTFVSPSRPSLHPLYAVAPRATVPMISWLTSCSYVQFAGYLFEDLTKLYKVSKLEALSFWTYINFSIYALLRSLLFSIALFEADLLCSALHWRAFTFAKHDLALTSDSYRIADTATPEENVHYRRRSFMILSCAAPLVWAKFLTIFDLCARSPLLFECL